MNFHKKPTTFVSHVHLKVTDLERSLKFYQEIIGFKVLKKTDRTAALTADGKTALLTIEQPEGAMPKQGRTTGLYHFALLLPSRKDLGKMLKHLIETGYPLQGASDHLVSEAVYLGDPDGNGIEIYADRPASAWTWHGDEVAMTTIAMDWAGVVAEAGDEPWTGLPAGTIMGHIHLHVSDLRSSEKFYTEGLGLEVVNRYGGMALFISAGKYHHHIGLNTWNGVGAPKPHPNSAGLKN
ncbi:MAG: VOC family protein, partial [Bacillales bacterium]